MIASDIPLTHCLVRCSISLTSPCWGCGRADDACEAGGLPALAASVARSAVGPAAGLGPLPHLPSIEPTSTAPPTIGHGWCAVCDGRSTVRFTVATVSPIVPFTCSPISPTAACVPATPCRTATRVVSTVACDILDDLPDILHDLLHRALHAGGGLPDACFHEGQLLCHGRTGMRDIVQDVICALSHCPFSCMVSTV